MSNQLDSLEISLLRKTLFVMMILGFVMSLVNTFTDIKHIYVTISTWILGVLCTVLYLLVRKNIYIVPAKYILTIFTFVTIVFCWVYNNQSYSPILAFYIMWVVFVVFLWDTYKVVFFLTVGMLTFFTLGFIDYSMPDFLEPYKTHHDRVIDMYLGTTFVISFIIIYSWHIKKAYVKKIKELKQAESLKTAFLQNISHEIRTPMNAIIGFSELLQTQSLTQQNKLKYIDTINASGRHLMSIIDDIMNISLLDAGQVTLSPKSVLLSKLLHSVYDQIKMHSLLSPKVILRAPVIELEKDYYLKIDEVKLKQVLQNLLVNAIKYTNVGYIEFGCRMQEANLEFYVKDTGIGIDSEQQKVIFERFTQIEKTHHSRFKGAGLGLSICKSYLELMGGTIDVRSQKGNGSIFSFIIPFEPVQEIDSFDFSTDENVPNKTLLIAEDEDVNYEFLKIVLEKHYTLMRARNGCEVVELMDQNEIDVDCILMDIKMPGMNGVEAAKLIKKNHPDVYIVAQTALNEIEDDFNIKHTCFDDYILKPINPKSLLSLLYIILE
ncbi:MAG: ATP-binding protein [Bacteroidales bacterium]|jgi:signal transduction histidine kinase/CheY-like chemotaxis protein|nr:ATP-binding protein [Bacteroidales bacterium]